MSRRLPPDADERRPPDPRSPDAATAPAGRSRHVGSTARAGARRLIRAGARQGLPVLLALASCGQDDPGDGGEAVTSYTLVPVARRELVLTVSATGYVEPIKVVEVKSKASGEILQTGADTGDDVEAGALLVQLDREDASNAYRNAEAELEVARAAMRVAESQMERADRLFEDAGLSQEEHEQVVLKLATARASLVKAENDLELARDRLEDTTVRAPSAGTILEKFVEEGHIVGSATSQVSGGTVLLKMADLSEVQVHMLVDEVDIGRIEPGQEAAIRFEAYPDQPFTGRVHKIEPQAVVDQSVTNFPVLVRIANDGGRLLPGMNCEIEIQIERRANALTLPNEAVHKPRDAAVIARALGLEPPELPGGPAGRERAGPPDQHGARPGAAHAAARPPGGGASSHRPDAASPAGTGRPAVVYVMEGDRLAPRLVRLGIANWDDVEILDGLEEDEQVAVTLSARTLVQQLDWRRRFQRVSGVPGLRKRR